MSWPFPAFASAALALLIERFTGYPKALHMKVGHPVEWMGRLIDWLDNALNKQSQPAAVQKLSGVAALLLLLIACFIPAWIVSVILARLDSGWIIEALIATAFFAQKSLRQHVRQVFVGLGHSLAEGRRAVSMIVGRDTSRLDESGISRAALESLAENTADGVVAPALWYALLGLPGLVLYKAINTADSMIGHKTERHLHFGWAAARLDDLVNLPASRLTGALFAAAAWITSKESAEKAWHAMWRDAPKHQSPNAGWPEAAMAAALGLRFGGPRSYEGTMIDLPWMGEGRRDLTRQDIRRGLRLYGRALSLFFVALLVISLF